MTRNTAHITMKFVSKWRRFIFCVIMTWIGYDHSFGQGNFQTSIDLSGIVYPEGVNFIEQDQDGFLWLATTHGLLRTDGYRHQWILQEQQIEISAIKVFESNLWIGTSDGGLIRVNRRNRVPDFRAQPTHSAVTCFEQSATGDIVFGTKSMGMGWITGGQTILLSNLFPDIDASIHCLQYWNNMLYVATDLGVYTLSDLSQPIPKWLDQERSKLGDQYVNAIATTSEALFLAGENGTITRLQKDGQFQLAHYFNGIHHTSISHLACYDDELLVIDRSSNVYSIALDWMSRIAPIVQQGDPLRHEPVLDMSINNQGTMMLAHGVPEVTSLDLIQTSFIEHDDVDLTNVNAIFLGKDRTIWMANADGLFAHNADFIDGQLMDKIIGSTGQEQIVAIAELDSLRIVVGTFGKGLMIVNRKTRKVQVIDERSGLINNHITAIEISGNQMWVATLGGLACLDKHHLHIEASYDASTPLDASYLYCVKAGLEQDLWIGTDGKGLIHFQNGQFVQLRQMFPDISKSITAIELDHQGRLWIMSLDKGIQCLENGKLISHSKISKTRMGEIGAMGIFSGDRLLVHSARGIFLYDPKDESLIMVNELRGKLAAGFQSMIIDEARQRVWLARYGDLWSCELDAFTTKHIPEVFLDGVLQSLSSIGVHEQTFGPDQNHFTFLLSVPWYVPNEFPSIQYRLLGLDSTWITTQERVLNYPKLAPGKYKLQAMVLLNGELILGQILEYEFEIEQPIYKKWWFLTTLILLLAILTRLIFKWREKQLENRTLIRQRQLEGELQVLRSQINPHFLFNSFNTLSYTIEKNQEEAVEYVEKLSDYFRLVLQRTEEPLIPMRDEINLVDHYIYLQKKRFGDLLEVEMNVASEYMDWLIPPMVTQIIIENAVKHNAISRERPLRVRVYIDADSLIVENNINAMIKKPVGTGTGLRNIQRRIEILSQREMIVEDGPHLFVVRVPLIEATKE